MKQPSLHISPMMVSVPSWRRRSLLGQKSGSTTRSSSSPLTNQRQHDPAANQENTSPNLPSSAIRYQSTYLPKQPPSRPSSALSQSDPSVKVVVRIRPTNGGGHFHGVLTNVSSDSLSITERNFNFDSVLDSKSTQEDVFTVVGLPLIQNALAGFNTSILSYGQSGSGKTYTMWGPPNALVDWSSADTSQGLVPRIIRSLFPEIRKNQECAQDEQINYQCRCSFLEIYNQQINDLLDPTLRNLQIRDDAKSGFYVENLTEEYVTAAEDVMQILVKGLSNRKVGATSTNSKSSRSHIIFTFVIESWCKGTSSKTFSSSKTSRITFTDLAGSDNEHLDDASRDWAKEGRQVKQSLSKLGKLVEILSGDAVSREDQNVPYKDSSLTHLLQESLGGNSKVTLICAISPENRSGTLSTLRFGERAKRMKNNAVVNEITEDDVNGLSDQIRQLKEELLKAKTCDGSLIDDNAGYFKGRNARDSLNKLRLSLNRSLILPGLDNDSGDEVDLNDDDVKELCQQLQNSKDISEIKGSLYTCLSEEYSDETVDSSIDSFMSVSCPQESPRLKECKHDVDSEAEIGTYSEFSQMDHAFVVAEKDCVRDSSVTVDPSRQFPFLDNPIVCTSPKIRKSLRKSLVTSSDVKTSTNQLCESPRLVSEKNPSGVGAAVRSSLQPTKVSPTESLAASLHRGLEVIDYHQQISSTKAPAVGLSFEHLAAISRQALGGSAASAKTILEKYDTSFLCASCKQAAATGHNKCGGESRSIDAEDGGSAMKRQMELENLCNEQAATIKQLSYLVEQYKLGGDKSAKTTEEPVEGDNASFDAGEKEALLQEVQSLRNQLKSQSDASASVSLLEHIRHGGSKDAPLEKTDDVEKERQRWMESESRWISLTEELRLDLDSNRRVAEKKEMELRLEKKCTAELDDALQRSILGHARIIEHYAELQEKYENLLGKHKKVMEGISEVKKAAKKAGARGRGPAFAKALAAELSTLRVERERERAYLKEQNRKLKLQLRDTAEAVHAAGELLVRLREAEEAVASSEEKCARAEHEVERLKKQVEKVKRKHAMEMVTMKHYLAESRLPESALEPIYRQEADGSEEARASVSVQGDESWRAAFRPSYQ